jgi:CheY-like chemotaxis protein
MLTPEARRKGLELTLEYPAGVPVWFEGDPGRFRQVVVNLAGNAIRYTDAGSVRVGAGWNAETQTMQLDVTDTGIGIAPDRLPLLFDRFSEVNEVSRRRAGGTGLGLAISKGIAENLGGRIDVRSEVGTGSTFTFYVPMLPVEGQNPDATALQAAASRDSLKGASILLVEDNLINQRVAVALLARLGCRVDIAADGAEGVRKALAHNYDAILMDCMMPVMDGFEATRAIRARQAQRQRTPIIALTASVMEDERRRCIAAGMDAILGKPVVGQTLAETLQAWAHRARRPADPA